MNRFEQNTLNFPIPASVVIPVKLEARRTARPLDPSTLGNAVQSEPGLTAFALSGLPGWEGLERVCASR